MSRSRRRQWPRGPTNALHDAASLGSTAGTVALLSSGSIDIDEGDPQGFTPLMCAAFAGHASVGRILLNKGANVFIKEDQGATALFFAVQQGHLDVTKLLVKVGSDLEVGNSVGQTPLFKAVVKGYTEVAGVLIEAGAGLNIRGPFGATPLWAAANGGHKDIVTMLLHAKANPLLTTDEEEEVMSLPLDAAAQNGHADVVLELIEHVGIEGCRGASVGIDALSLAAEFEHVGVMAILTSARVVDTGQALCKAAENSCEESVKFLLQEQQRKRWATSCRGGYVHATGRHFNRTPLCCGIHGYSPRVVRRLLDAGADTTTGVHVSRIKAGAVTCNETPLAYTAEFISELTAAGEDANEDRLRKLEATRRLLLQVDAVHAVSWLWLTGVSCIGANGPECTRRTKMTPAAGTPLTLTLPTLRRRAGRRGALLAALWRYSAKASKESETDDEGEGACCHQK